MTTAYVGVDVGLTGAIAVVSADGRLASVWDMPTAGGEVMPGHLATILGDIKGDLHATVEEVHSMPKQGVASSFGFGTSKGIVLGVLGALRIPYTRVSASVWKRATPGVTADKATSLRAAIEKWPHLHEDLRLKKHDGRAEALLIADYGRRINVHGVA